MTTVPVSVPDGFASWPVEARAAWCDAQIFQHYPLRRLLARAPLPGEFPDRPGATPNVVIVDRTARFQRHGICVRDTSIISNLTDADWLVVLRDYGCAI